jgi:DNA-binding HxlR family transcriptional regulator
VNFNRLYDALHFFSHRGTFEILSALEHKPLRYSAVTREVLHLALTRGEGHHIPSANTLNDTLARLVEGGLVNHEGFWYSLTERGRQVLPLTAEYVKNLGWWDEERAAGTRVPDGK